MCENTHYKVQRNAGIGESMKKETVKKTCTHIGGQAVMEGIMMRGKCAMATAVRDPEGQIQIESERLTPPEKRKKITYIQRILELNT